MSPDFINKPENKDQKIEAETEIQKQTKLLGSINGKLGFFVFILVMYIIIQIFNVLLSF